MSSKNLYFLKIFFNSVFYKTKPFSDSSRKMRKVEKRFDLTELIFLFQYDGREFLNTCTGSRHRKTKRMNIRRPAFEFINAFCFIVKFFYV